MRFIAATLLLFLSFSANAVEYYWYVKGSNGNVHYVTPRAGCDAAFIAWKKIYSNGIETGYRQISATEWQCNFRSSPSGSNYSQTNMVRGGDSCVSPSVYDDTTGSCILPAVPVGQKCAEKDATGLDQIGNSAGKCVPYLDADQAAQCKYLGTQGTRGMTFWIPFSQDGNPQMPPSPNEYGCAVKILSVAECKLPAAKSSSSGISLAPAQVAKCRVGAYFTGETSGTGSMVAADPASGTGGICGDGKDCSVPDEPTVQEQKPCNYTTDAEGRKVCSSSQFTGDPGSMDCGSVNGKFSCITKPAKSTGQMTDTKVDTKANADGSTTTTKTDTITQVTCGGAGSCVSTTTKVSQVTTKDGNGNTTGNSTSCTGAKCATSTNPDADGDGLGDCVKDCDKGSPSVGALTKPDSGSFDGMGDEWDQKISDAKNELMDKVDQLKSAFNPIGNVSLSSGGTLYCADAPEVLGKKFDACVSVYDEQLSWIALAILVTCACIALCIVFI